MANHNGPTGRVFIVLYSALHRCHCSQSSDLDHILSVRPLLNHPLVADGLHLRDDGRGHGGFLQQPEPRGQVGADTLFQFDGGCFKSLPHLQKA